MRTGPAPAVRTMREDDWDGFVDLAEHAFAESITPGHRAFLRAILDPDRGLVVADDDAVVAVAASYALRMRVPGALRPMAGISWVAVSPTHRRRGLLRALMERQLRWLHEREEPLAALWASEAAIYGRFGYGSACRQLALRVPLPAPLADPPVDPALRLRLAEPEAARPEVARVRAAVLDARPGTIAHDPRWGGRHIDDPASPDDGRPRAVLAEDAAGPRGFALYAARAEETPLGPGGEVTVHELEAVDPPAAAALWRHVLDLDLMRTLRAGNRPVDDPLMSLLAHPDRAERMVGENLWVRLVDVRRALAERRYAAPLELVLEVRDPVCPWNAGRLRLEADASGAACTPTDAAPHLTLSSTELGAAYMGGASLRALAAAGRVEERRPGALDAAGTAFAHDPAPWCAMYF